MKPAWLIVAFAVVDAALAHAAPNSDWLRAQIARAPAGATIEVLAGVQRGPFVIERSLHLRGAPGAVLEGSGSGNVVSIRAPDVEIAGFLIRRSGANLSTDDAGIHVSAPRATIRGNTIVDTLHGIYLRAAAECRIENNIIRGRASPEVLDDPLTRGLRLDSPELCSVQLGQDQRGNGIHIWNCGRHVIVGNDIRGTRDGIYFSFCDDTQVRRNRITEVRYGLHYMYSNGNLFEENVFTQNAAGSALMFSHDITLRRNRFVANRSHRAYGLLMHTVESTVVEENTIEGNTVGAFLESCVDDVFRGNDIAGNYIALHVSGSSDQNRFTANLLRGNVHSVELGGAPEANAWSADGVGNFWDDALKLDLDGNGIADVPHREADLFGRWRADFPEIGLLSGSPGERALRFLHARLNLPGISAVHDPAPLVRPTAP